MEDRSDLPATLNERKSLLAEKGHLKFLTDTGSQCSVFGREVMWSISLVFSEDTGCSFPVDFLGNQ